MEYLKEKPLDKDDPKMKILNFALQIKNNEIAIESSKEMINNLQKKILSLKDEYSIGKEFYVCEIVHKWKIFFKVRISSRRGQVMCDVEELKRIHREHWDEDESEE